jgi:hypothetical protein
MQMIRVVQFRADMAKDLLPIARLNGDAMVINACIRIRQGWLLGHKVAVTDLNLVAEFHAACWEG